MVCEYNLWIIEINPVRFMYLYIWHPPMSD